MIKYAIFLILIAVLLIVIGSFGMSYIFLKKAIKNGVLEALEEYNSKNNCEE